MDLYIYGISSVAKPFYNKVQMVINAPEMEDKY